MRVYPIARLTLLPLIRGFVRETTGLENLPRQGPFIIASNHVGSLDGAFIGGAVIPFLNRKVSFITRIAEWGTFWRNVVSRRWAATIPFDEKNPRSCLDEARHRLERGEIVGIFPQGMLEYLDANGGRAKTGVARLALWTRAPVVPVAIFNQRSFSRWAVIRNAIRHPKTIRLSIGAPMTFPDAYGKEITHELLRNVADRIMGAIERLVEPLRVKTPQA